jgi:hypothetical protein
VKSYMQNGKRNLAIYFNTIKKWVTERTI